jgi:hypothetical protein
MTTTATMRQVNEILRLLLNNGITPSEGTYAQLETLEKSAAGQTLELFYDNEIDLAMAQLLHLLPDLIDPPDEVLHDHCEVCNNYQE